MQLTSRAAIHRDMVLVPEMDKNTFESLMESMRLLGQLVAIKTHRGEVVDGRARLRACQRLKIEPIIEKIDPNLDPLDVIEHINYRRRHEEDKDIAITMARISDRRRVTKQQLRNAGISQRTLDHAKKVLRDGIPELIDAVENKEVAVSFGSEITDLPTKQHQAEALQKIQQGKKSEVRSELKSAAPVRKQATNERPTVRYPETEVMTPDKMVDSFNRTEDRIETLKRLFLECEPHELRIVATFLPVECWPTEHHTQEPVIAAIEELSDDDEPIEVDPEILDLETIEIVRDRVSDEMIESPKMVGLEGRIGSLATAVGAVRLLFAATEKYAPQGDIGKLSDPAIAKACGFTGPADLFVSAMVQEGFLQRDIQHRLLVTDWPDLCLPELAEELCGTAVGYAEPTGIPKFKEPKQRKVKNEPAPIYSDAFLDFWNAYPPKGRAGKDKAWKSWQESIKRATPPEGQAVEAWLIQRAKDFAQSEKAKSEYVPATEVWLNQGRWDDAPEAWTRGSKKEAEKADWTKELRQAPKSLFAKT